MKRLNVFIIMLLFAAGAMAQTTNQKIEVLYFKSNASCCEAKTCNRFENITRDIISKNFSNEIDFKAIVLTDGANKSLIDKYKAKSQTLIIVNHKKKKNIDISNALSKYARDNDKIAFEKEIIKKINQIK